MTGPDPIRVEFVSAPCSSGKTYAACQFIKKHHRFQNHLYVAPTKELIRETKTTLEEKFGIEPTVITSDTHSSVKRGIVEHLKTCDAQREVLLITLAAYLDLPYFNRRKHWRVIIDEIPPVDQFYAIDLHQHREHLLEYVEPGSLIGESVLPMQPQRKGRLRKLLENPDDITLQLKPFYTDLLSANKDVFVDLKTWTPFEAGEVSTERGGNRVYVLSMLNPEAFRDCIMLGANFEESMIHAWFSRQHDVLWTPQQEIINTLRFEHHPQEIGQRLQINYLLQDRGHSKRLMRKTLNEEGQTFLEQMDRDVVDFFNGKEFLYAANEDYQGILADEDLKREHNIHAQKIPTQSHGLNCFTECTRIYFGPALNRPPAHQRMLHHLGFGNKFIKSATLHETAYQALMRTNLRDPDSHQVVTCVVPEWHTANRLVDIFQGAQLKWIGSDEYRKLKPLTKTERNQRNTFNQLRERRLGVNHGSQALAAGITVNPNTGAVLPRNRDISLKNSTYENCPDFGAEIEFTEEILIPTRHDEANAVSDGHARASTCASTVSYPLTFHGSIFDKEPEDFITESIELQQFLTEFKQEARTPIDSKEDLFLFNPAIFDPVDPEGVRRQVNFVSSSMLVLDFDDGDLSIEAFTRIFWHEAGRGRRSFVICNSFSRNGEQPNRFRVLLLYKEPARSIAEHQAVYDAIVAKLEDYGYPPQRSGLDKSCRTGIQSFYVPCTNRHHPRWACFEKYGTKTREVKRYGIVPASYLKTALQRPKEVVLIDTDDPWLHLETNKEERIERIKDEVRNLTEGRHDPFFTAGLKLRGLDLPESEIRIHLEELESDIGKGHKQWAKYVMQSLKRSSNQYPQSTH